MFAKRFFYVCAAILCIAVAYHLGASHAGAQGVITYQETAVLSGVVADGGAIPLPHYQDGSEALESECTWTVSINELGQSISSGGSNRCYTDGRVVHVVNTCCPLSGTANYLIIAVRNSTPTPVQRTSLGALKVKYR